MLPALHFDAYTTVFNQVGDSVGHLVVLDGKGLRDNTPYFIARIDDDLKAHGSSRKIRLNTSRLAQQRDIFVARISADFGENTLNGLNRPFHLLRNDRLDCASRIFPANRLWALCVPRLVFHLAGQGLIRSTCWPPPSGTAPIVVIDGQCNVILSADRPAGQFLSCSVSTTWAPSVARSSRWVAESIVA
jgi:hypothetical protein